MKNFFLAALLPSMLLSATSCSKHGDLVGDWIVDDEKLDDCPDVVSFRSDGIYSVLNDCYGVDHANPVVEVGRWRVYADSDVRIDFYERTLKSNYDYMEGRLPAPVKISLLTMTDMSLCYMNTQGGECNIEKYKRR